MLTRLVYTLLNYAFADYHKARNEFSPLDALLQTKSPNQTARLCTATDRALGEQCQPTMLTLPGLQSSSGLRSRDHFPWVRLRGTSGNFCLLGSVL